MQTDPTFGFEVPTECPEVPSEILIPKNTWDDPEAYDQQAQKLAGLFADHFEKYEDMASPEIAAAGPTAETAKA
jgi:phosphoenolpyruvate carboxykinase (ATP)